MTAAARERLHLIDALRGFALLAMLSYHLFYDIVVIFGGDYAAALSPPAVAWSRLAGVMFVLISGVSLNLSHHAVGRGVRLCLLAFVVTAVTYFAVPSQAVYFGVLGLLGASMIICQKLRPLLNRCNPFAGAAASLALFAVTFGVPKHYLGFFDVPVIRLPDALYGWRALSFLGFPDPGLRSSDYYPLIPWLFLFLCGYFLWRVIRALNAERFFTIKIAPLCFLGRHTLIIYIIHQPLLYGLCALILG